MNNKCNNRRGRDCDATFLPKDEVGISYPPDRTALLVIDPVNDFLSEGGARLGVDQKHRGEERRHWPSETGDRRSSFARHPGLVWPDGVY